MDRGDHEGLEEADGDTVEAQAARSTQVSPRPQDAITSRRQLEDDEDRAFLVDTFIEGNIPR